MKTKKNSADKDTLTVAELALAVIDTEADYEAGRFVSESVDDHIKRVTQ